MKQLLLFLSVLLSFCLHLHAEGDTGQGLPQTQNKQVESSPSPFFDAVDAPVTYKATFVKMMLTLLALVILIVLSVWMLKRISHGRMKQMNYDRAIKILERRPLSAKSALYLVEVAGKKVVIAESQLEVRAITTADHLSDELT